MGGGDLRQGRQEKTSRAKTRQNKTKQDKADKARQDKTRQDKTRQDKTRRDKTRHETRQEHETRQDKTRFLVKELTTLVFGDPSFSSGGFMIPKTCFFPGGCSVGPPLSYRS